MKAIVLRKFGGPEVFEPVELPTPTPGPGQVLIRVAASSVNPIELKIRSGLVPALAPTFPLVLNGDVSGTVEATGPGVRGFVPGDEVVAYIGGVKDRQGALADYALADAVLCARKPASLSLVDAASIPIAGITAWLALVERVRILPGQKVLVHGGCGGVGHLGIQLAALAGAKVHTTVSTEEKANIARELGAHETILYRKESTADYLGRLTGGKGFDLVFDTVGGETLATSLQAARAGGTVVTINARSPQDLGALHAKGLTLHGVFMILPFLSGEGLAGLGDTLNRLCGLFESGRLRLLHDREIFDFAHVAEAHRRLESGKAIGKIRLARQGIRPGEM